MWDTKVVKAVKDMIIKGGEWINKDELVACPTETVYGLCANGLSVNAINKIYIAKGRPSDNPIILHVNNRKMIEKDLKLDIPKCYDEIIEKFWPGPLTIILKSNNKIPSILLGGGATVAIRIPSHPIMRELIEASKKPIAAPSANKSGLPSPTCAYDVYEDMNGLIPLILDGECDHGLESTVINLLVTPPCIMRPGSITKEQLEKYIPNIVLYEKYVDETIPISPGLKYKHYAPKSPVMIIKICNPIHILKNIKELSLKYKKIGTIMKYSINKWLKEHDPVGIHIVMGDQDESISSMARDIFKCLRIVDRKGVDLIIVHEVENKEVGMAFMNRLLKAADGSNIEKLVS